MSPLRTIRTWRWVRPPPVWSSGMALRGSDMTRPRLMRGLHPRHVAPVDAVPGGVPEGISRRRARYFTRRFTGSVTSVHGVVHEPSDSKRSPIASTRPSTSSGVKSRSLSAPCSAPSSTSSPRERVETEGGRVPGGIGRHRRLRHVVLAPIDEHLAGPQRFRHPRDGEVGGGLARAPRPARARTCSLRSSGQRLAAIARIELHAFRATGLRDQLDVVLAGGLVTRERPDQALRDGRRGTGIEVEDDEIR